MVNNYPLADRFSKPEQRRSSDPTWSTQTQSGSLFTPPKSTLRTPHTGKQSKSRSAKLPKARGSPYMTPHQTRETVGLGRTVSMKLFKPDEVSKVDLLLNRASSTSSPMTSPTHPHSTNTSGRARLSEKKPNYLVFPSNKGVRDSLPKLVSPPMQGTPRQVNRPRPRDPARPTVQLLKVMNKCWDDDTEKERDWAVTNAYLNGRNDERDKSAIWNTLDRAVGAVWPELRNWIMGNPPSYQDDITWFTSTERIDVGDERYIYDPDLATKDSSLDPVGFHMTPSTYDAACNIIKDLARRGNSLDCLIGSGINPFFIIYACADCDIPLPIYFNREFLWKHLDAILRTKCWRGLGSARGKTQYRTSANEDHLPLRFLRKGGDPDGTLESLIRLSYEKSRFGSSPTPAPATALEDVPPRPVHELQITIKDFKWVVKFKAQLGTVWYQAGDLYDEDDIACFAAIDTLTRLLPSCRGGILEISTRDIRLMWGVGGKPSDDDAWSVVHNICMNYQVSMRAKWSKLKGPDPCERINAEERKNTVPPRDRDVVEAVVSDFRQRQLDTSKVAYRYMVDHLVQVTT